MFSKLKLNVKTICIYCFNLFAQKCKLVNRDLFTSDLTDENADQSTNRTSTPQNQGTVNHVVSPIIAPLTTGKNIQTVDGTNEGGVPTISPPTNVMGVSVKLDHLSNAVSTINSRLISMGTEVQDVKTKGHGMTS